MAYPDTSLSTGVQDDPFGGQPANRFGSPMRAFIDAQIQEIQKQILADSWEPYRFIRAAISTGGSPGDAIVFDTSVTAAAGGYTMRQLKTGGYTDAATTPLFGILIDTVAAAAVGRVAIGGILPPSVTGLAAAAGALTVDGTTGKLRLKTGSETVYGYSDPNGNAFLLFAERST